MCCMKFDISEMKLPFWFRSEPPMPDDELQKFCAANDFVRVEREASGDILVMSPANSRTILIRTRVRKLLYKWATENAVGVSFKSTCGFKLADGSMRTPDAAWVARSRWNSLKDEERSSFPSICPDFVIEIRSPSDKIDALQAKMQLWIENGASEAWLIDPESKEVSVYRERDSPEIHYDTSSVQAHGVTAGFELVMVNVWV